MVVFVALLMVVAVIAFIGYPLMAGPEPKPVRKKAAGDAAARLQPKLEAAAVELEKVRAEFASGQLSEEDYRLLEARLRGRVEGLEGKVKSSPRRPAVDEEIEKEVRRLRGKRGQKRTS